MKPASAEAALEVGELVADVLDCASELRRIVLLSEIDAGTRTEDLDERQVEKLIEGSGLEWTILRPHWFMQNFSDASFYLGQLTSLGTVSVPTGGRATSCVDTRDVGEVAAVTLLDASHAGKRYTLTGPASITWSEAISMISLTSGRRFSYDDVALEPYLAERTSSHAPKNFQTTRAVYEFLSSSAASAVSEDVERVLGKPARSFEDFAKEKAPMWR